MKRICIIQTGMGSSAELSSLCTEIIPDANVIQIIDDGILQEVRSLGRLTPAVGRRMYAYCQQAQAAGADVILYPCVAVSGLVEQIQPFLDIPIIRIDEGMARLAVRTGRQMAVFATEPLALEQSVRLLNRRAEEAGRKVTLTPVLLKNAPETVRAAAEQACAGNDLLLLAQPSMTGLLPLLEGLSRPVLHCSRIGIEYLKNCL